MANAIKAPLKKEKEFIEIELGDTKELVEVGSLEHQVLTQEYDSEKKYMFEIAALNEQRDIPIIDLDSRRTVSTPKYKPFGPNIILTSQIVWKKQRRQVRYYDGCTTIFADKQPQDKELMQELMKGTNKDRLHFVQGKFGAFGYERLLLLYLNIASWNDESPFRTNNASAVYRAVNAEKLATKESQQLDLQEKAFDTAKSASLTKMLIHAAYLGITTQDFDSGNERTELEIRTDYRKFALKHPVEFLDSYGNETLEVKYFIQKAWEGGLMNRENNPNVAQWKSGKVICDISGLQSLEGIVSKIYEFSQTPEGEEFSIQLKALND